MPGLSRGPGPWRSFTIAIGDQPGEGWRTDRPSGLWRSVGGGRPSSPDYGEEVLGLVRQFSPRSTDAPPMDVSSKPGLGSISCASCATSARRGSAPRDGLSLFTHDAERLDRAKTWLTSYLLPPALEDSRLVTHGGPVTVPRHFNSHADGLSPNSGPLPAQLPSRYRQQAMFKRRAPMRTCNHCSVWFAPGRVDQRFCSAFCRGAAHRTEKAQ